MAMQDVLHRSEHGAGWIPLMMTTLIDWFTQDNGAFIEIVRTGRGETSPVYQLNHLDSARCIRTGKHEAPVIYYDGAGQGHELKWYEVIPLAEMPSPREIDRGIQMCGLSRALRGAQIARDIDIYNREKVNGRNPKKIHLVSGVSTKYISDALAIHQSNADNQGLLRFVAPLVLGTIDPTAKVDHAEIDMASLPDSYDQDTAMKWYLTLLALAFGSDYQDFAPVSTTGQSTGNQSQTSHLKARGKGAALFMRAIEQAFNWHGVLPSNVSFAFGEQDQAAALETILVMKEYALTLQILVDSGTITPQVSRQLLVDRGFMPRAYLDMMSDPDRTDSITQPGSEHIDETTTPPGDPGPKTPPGTGSAGGGAGSPPTPNNANNNNERTRTPSGTQRPVVPA